MNKENERKKLVENLRSDGYLSDEKVIKAMLKVPREEFLPRHYRSQAYEDCPLSIGGGQTISAPHMVAMMSEHLDVGEDHKILEIGAGSGYQAAILAEILAGGVGEASIITVERVPELAKSAGETLKKLGYENVKIVIGDGTMGYKKGAPYDRIIVTAASQESQNPCLNS